MAAQGSKKHATSAIIERDDEALLLVISRGLGATLILLLLAITGFLFIQEIGSIIKAPSQSITGHVATELARALYEALHSLYATLGQLAWTLNAAMYGPDFSTRVSVSHGAATLLGRGLYYLAVALSAILMFSTSSHAARRPLRTAGYATLAAALLFSAPPLYSLTSSYMCRTSAPEPVVLLALAFAAGMTALAWRLSRAIGARLPAATAAPASARGRLAAAGGGGSGGGGSGVGPERDPPRGRQGTAAGAGKQRHPGGGGGAAAGAVPNSLQQQQQQQHSSPGQAAATRSSGSNSSSPSSSKGGGGASPGAADGVQGPARSGSASRLAALLYPTSSSTPGAGRASSVGAPGQGPVHDPAAQEGSSHAHAQGGRSRSSSSSGAAQPPAATAAAAATANAAGTSGLPKDSGAAQALQPPAAGASASLSVPHPSRSPSGGSLAAAAVSGSGKGSGKANQQQPQQGSGPRPVASAAQPTNHSSETTAANGTGTAAKAPAKQQSSCPDPPTNVVLNGTNGTNAKKKGQAAAGAAAAPAAAGKPTAQPAAAAVMVTATAAKGRKAEGTSSPSTILVSSSAINSSSSNAAGRPAGVGSASTVPASAAASNSFPGRNGNGKKAAIGPARKQQSQAPQQHHHTPPPQYIIVPPPPPPPPRRPAAASDGSATASSAAAASTPTAAATPATTTAAAAAAPPVRNAWLQPNPAVKAPVGAAKRTSSAGGAAFTGKPASAAIAGRPTATAAAAAAATRPPLSRSDGGAAPSPPPPHPPPTIARPSAPGAAPHLNSPLSAHDPPLLSTRSSGAASVDFRSALAPGPDNPFFSPPHSSPASATAAASAQANPFTPCNALPHTTTTAVLDSPGSHSNAPNTPPATTTVHLTSTSVDTAFGPLVAHKHASGDLDIASVAANYSPSPSSYVTSATITPTVAPAGCPEESEFSFFSIPPPTGVLSDPSSLPDLPAHAHSLLPPEVLSSFANGCDPTALPHPNQHPLAASPALVYPTFAAGPALPFGVDPVWGPPAPTGHTTSSFSTSSGGMTNSTSLGLPSQAHPFHAHSFSPAFASGNPQPGWARPPAHLDAPAAAANTQQRQVDQLPQASSGLASLGFVESGVEADGGGGDGDADASSSNGGDDASAGATCTICWSGPRQVGFLHGKTSHLCVCRRCAAHLREGVHRCPMCRQLIERIIDIF